MAAIKIFPITATEVKALTYIANPEKTDNGRLIVTSGCSSEPNQASKEFEEIRANGTGRNTVLSQHFIVSFQPDEITPERALQVGQEICEKFLKGEYQYFLACHTDKSHTHLHCIFNNVNCFDGRTFETHENRRTTKQDHSFQKLRDISDEVCEKYHLSVIQNPEQSRGKNYYEWGMNRQGLSWKAKLKFAIDQVVRQSDNFEDFLKKCADFGIEVSYNPNHKIDLKFRMKGQQKWSRAKTLGWYYETAQIKKRIDMYKGVLNYQPRTKIIRTTAENFQDSVYLNRWADIQNMKEASRVINILMKYGVQDSIDLENRALTDYARMGTLSEELNTLNTQIQDLSAKIKSAHTYLKYKPIIEEMKTLPERKKKKFAEVHADEIARYRKASQQLKEWFPDGSIPTPDSMERKREKLIQERQSKHETYKSLKSQISELNYARQALSDYLKNELEISQLKRKKSELE